MRVLITGAKGQLGNEIGVLTDNYKWDFRFTDIDELELTDASKVKMYIADYKPDYLINCAAYTAVDKAETDNSGAEVLNARVPENLSILSIKTGFKLIHISTDYVFSGKGYVPWKENDITQPESVYGSTKLLGELLVLKNCEPVIIRTSWLYSTFGNNFVKSMIRLGKEKENLGVVFDQVGSPTYAADLAQTVLDVISYSEKNKSWKSGIYHYSNEGVASWYDFASEIMELAGLHCKVMPIETADYPLPAPRPMYSVMNKQKIKTAFHVDIPHWKNSLKKMIHKL